MTSGDIIGLATLWAQACLDAPRWPSYSKSHQTRTDQARERFVQAVAAMQAENEVLRAAVSTERERCARLCAEMGAATWWPNEERDMADLLRKMILDGREHARDAKEQKP